MTDTSTTEASTTATGEVTIADLKKDAKGKWADIFDDVMPKVLDEAYAANGFHVPCPVHGGSDGFRLFSDFEETGGTVCNTCRAHPDGFSTLAWLLEKEFGKGAFREGVRRVTEWLKVGHAVRLRAERKPLEFRPPADPARAYAKIAEAYRGSKELTDTPAERYLLSRGLPRKYLPKGARAHPGLNYWDAKTKKDYGTFPCLVAPIKDKNNKIVSLHRIYLTPEGAKAPVPDCKKMMAMCDDIRGAAIRLYEAKGPVLGVAEGIETAIAAHVISQMPVWSCVSAPLLELVEVPAHVTHVVIWADKDRNGRGEDAANRLADRLEKEGKKVEICMPPQDLTEADKKGIDWLDVLVRWGRNGFPAHWRRWRPSA